MSTFSGGVHCMRQAVVGGGGDVTSPARGSDRRLGIINTPRPVRKKVITQAQAGESGCECKGKSALKLTAVDYAI